MDYIRLLQPKFKRKNKIANWAVSIQANDYCQPLDLGIIKMKREAFISQTAAERMQTSIDLCSLFSSNLTNRFTNIPMFRISDFYYLASICASLLYGAVSNNY